MGILVKIRRRFCKHLNLIYEGKERDLYHNYRCLKCGAKQFTLTREAGFWLRLSGYSYKWVQENLDPSEIIPDKVAFK